MNDGELPFGNRSHKAVIVLAHLLKGGRSFQLDGRTYVLSEDYDLCELRTNDQGEEVLLRFLGGLDLSSFIKMCEQLSEQDTFMIGASTAMIRMAEERLNKRERAQRERSQARGTA